MKKMLKKISLMLVVLCSLFTMFVGSGFNVKASNETEIIKETINIVSTIRENNKIIFTTQEKYNVDSITYQIVYKENDVNYGDLVTNAKVEKIDDYNYSFEVSDIIIGVKIWKVKYFISTDNFKNKMTTGNNFVGDVNSTYNKNYVEVRTDYLEQVGGDSCETSGFSNVTCEKYYVFYFNLDTEIDSIVSLSMEYSIKTEKKAWYGLDKSTSTKSYETTLNHSQEVVDYEKAEEYVLTWLSNNEDYSYEEFNNTYNYAIETYKRPVLGENVNGNGYDWYVQPLLDITLTDKQYFGYSGYYKESLQEVAIIKMSYYSKGEYFEEIPVLDEDTGLVNIIDNGIDIKGFIDKIINFFKENTWAIWVLVILLFYPIIQLLISLVVTLFKIIMIPINAIIGIFSGINESAKRRRNKKREKRIREEEVYRYEENRRRNDKYIENRQYDDKKMRKYRNYK